ncbi:SDR family oxidoreductase [Alkalihalophilus pseudofirmus]|uniref:SDR family oxidoreductase n=1 Tax=Alkalihalophilus pseudofirmus TaxID=79885 RepID=UPI00259B0383|nr:SDR family oxidoreductase [Alkalihalophilus pseudofirmus]WEG15334.1 SDR family oxidoreductase [Alkalihalophilus pseudofirmus]
MDIKRFNKSARFLVTGGAGFIGSNIAEFLLNNGFEVRVLDDYSNGRIENIDYLKSKFDIEFINGTIEDFNVCLKATENIDFVLHQAAWGSVPRSIKIPLIYDRINIHGTLNMLEASKRNNINKFVYASSSSVYGDDIRLPKVEGNEGNPLSPYAITKKVNELYAKNYFDLFGLQTIGLRYFNVFGKRQDPHSTYAAVIPIFIKYLLENKAPKINGDGTQTRDFTYIDNVIEANLLSCLSTDTANGESFNIAYGTNISINELYLYVSSLLGKEIKPIYGPSREGDILQSKADISKAQKILGYNPKVDVYKGLRETIEWYIQHV